LLGAGPALPIFSRTQTRHAVRATRSRTVTTFRTVLVGCSGDGLGSGILRTLADAGGRFLRDPEVPEPELSDFWPVPKTLLPAIEDWEREVPRVAQDPTPRPLGERIVERT